MTRLRTGARGLPLILIGLLSAGMAQAQPAPRVYGELAACRALRDVAARVACYDAIALPAAPEAAAAAVPPPAARAAGPASAPADFGLPPPPIAAQPQVMQSRIAGRFEGWSPGTRLRLDNGQVWEVVDGSSAAYDLNAPAVNVRRGVLGSFFLEIDGVSATPRVRRVQ
jgi:hypothetical protein